MSALSEAEAYARLFDLAALATVTTSRLDQAVEAAGVAGLRHVARELEKVREVHRPYARRVTALIRQVEGSAR